MGAGERIDCDDVPAADSSSICRHNFAPRLPECTQVLRPGVCPRGVTVSSGGGDRFVLLAVGDDQSVHDDRLGVWRVVDKPKVLCERRGGCGKTACVVLLLRRRVQLNRADRCRQPCGTEAENADHRDHGCGDKITARAA